MERKRIIRRAALIGAALLAVALATLAATAVAVRRNERRGQAERDARVAQVTKEYQAYLDETAQKIKGVPVDPKVIGEIQTRHYQQRPALWLYVWATDNAGAFLFGVPSDAFARLNTAFDQYQPVIARDNHFATRDQFLRTLLHNPRRIGPPDDERDDRRGPARDRDANWWRFYRENDDEEYSRGRNNRLFLSSPIQDAAGATVGNLNLKLVDNREGRRDSSQEHGDDVMKASLVVSVLSLVWLWFMLPSWVYIDAQQRGVPRPLLWSLLTLIGSVFALMVYLISRPTGPTEFRCPHCGKTLNGSKAACPYCGTDLSAVFCPRCQYPVKPDWSFCPSCRGALVRAPAAPAEAAGTSG